MDFVEQYRDLIFNIFIILMPLLIIKYTIPYKNNLIYPLLIYVIFVIPMILTMNMPIQTEASVYDLRGIPLIIGSLYGGVYTLLLLFASLITYRFSLGGLELFNYMVALTPIFIVLYIFIAKFKSFQLRNKIIAVIAAMFFLRITVLSIYLILGGRTITLSELFNFSIPTFIVQSIIAGFIVYVIEAIEKNKQLENAMFATEKLEIVSVMGASVAHEIRNPLSALKGFVELLEDNNLPIEKRKLYINMIKEELEGANEMISRYLALAKPGDETVEVIDLKSEFTYLTNILRSYTNHKNVQINNHIKNSIMIKGSRTEFRQAIINLSKNALEAMPNGGTLEFCSKKTGDEVELSIIDNGTGMSPEQVKTLGNAYHTTKAQGTGLGTMISFNIIKKMSGEINVSSDLGQGTKFIITLLLNGD